MVLKIVVITGLKTVIIFTCTEEFLFFSAKHCTSHKNKTVIIFFLEDPPCALSFSSSGPDWPQWLHMTTNRKSVNSSGAWCWRGRMMGHVALEQATKIMTSSFKPNLKLFCCFLSWVIERNRRGNWVTKSSSWLEKSELSDWGSL